MLDSVAAGAEAAGAVVAGAFPSEVVPGATGVVSNPFLLSASTSEFSGAATGASLSKSDFLDSRDFIVVSMIELTINPIAKNEVNFVMKFPLAELEKTA